MIKAKGIPYRQAKIGDAFNWGKNIKVELLREAEGLLATRNPEPMLLDFDMLMSRASVTASGTPNPPNPPNTSKISANEQSLIFRVTAGKVSYLFTGDAEKDGEAAAIKKFRDKLKCTVLKSGHHGSKTSSGYPFLDLAKPEYAVIQVGARNSFKHPSAETLDKYNFYKIKTFRTDLEGTVDSFTDGETVKFHSNASELEFTQKPQIVALTPTSVTIQWGTNKNSNTQVAYKATGANQEKLIANAVTLHTVTITGLKANQKYSFTAISQDARQPEQIVRADGTFQTPAGDGVEMPKIVAVATNFPQIYMKQPFEVQVGLGNGAPAPAKVSVELYHTGISKDMKLGEIEAVELPAKGQLGVKFPTEIGWMGDVELVVVLRKDGKIIDTSSLSLDVKPKIMLVDCIHGNIEYYTGKFAGMKMDLGKHLGFDMRSISKTMTYDSMKYAFVVAITNPEKAFTAEELAALKQYVNGGGSLMLFGRSDYGNRSKPEILNEILAAIGSGIRFNDDGFCDPTNNIGAPWKALLRVFPSPIIQSVTNVITMSACTLLNHKMGGLVGNKTLHLLAVGDDDCYNIDGDQLGDGVLYASMTKKLPLPVIAAEDLGMGRVACYGEPLYEDRMYNPNPSIQTPQLNRCVVEWLSLAKEKTLREILESMAALDSVADKELAAMRYDEMKKVILENVQAYVKAGNPDAVKDSFDGVTGKAITKIKGEIKSILKFQTLHNESRRHTENVLNGL
jgi:hypothetical protein